jgi:hypothetical protein
MADAAGSVMRALALALAVALLGASPPWRAPLAAQDQECCLLLLVPVGARASGLSGAVTARGGTDAMYRNPAGLAALEGSAFFLHHADRSLVDVNAFSLILTPVIGTVAVSYQLFDYGNSTMRDDSGQETGQLTFRDHLGMASYATTLGRSTAVGASYKLFQERVDCRGACGGMERVTTHHAVDLGYRYRPHWNPSMALGLSVVNLAVGTQGSGAEEFPARVHAGAAYDLLSGLPAGENMALWLALEIQDELRRPGTLTPSVGIELDVQETVFVRAGYTPGRGVASGAAVGLGLRYERWAIGISRAFINSQGLEDEEPFQISFGIHF